MNRLVLVSHVSAAVGCGLFAGLMLAFSTAVMSALGRQPAASGIATMQAINVTILNPIFGFVFGGTTVACLVLAATAAFASQGPSGWVLAGALLFLIGALLITMIFNVPLNNRVAEIDPDSAEGARIWADYLVVWTRWNHIRTVASGAAAVILTLGLLG